MMHVFKARDSDLQIVLRYPDLHIVLRVKIVWIKITDKKSFFKK